uniref:Formin like 1 n=1 Tax=Cyclopterus lumpus TaxID=8103 RepID=A0A8C2Z998_CYCLU
LNFDHINKNIFNIYMNLPPDKLKLLSQYDNDKKWELVCDQERFQVKSPPSTYLAKIKSFYQDQGGVSRRKRIQDATQVLKDLEISLRTNHIGWAQEFLNERNKGLDILVEYLSHAQSDVSFDVESVENGGTLSERGKPLERSMEDLTKSSSGSPSHGMTRAARALTVRLSSTLGNKMYKKSHSSNQRDDVHVCIMCLRAIMNYQSGFNLVMTHPRCVNEITLSLNSRNPRTKALVLELLAAVCLVRGGHDIILLAFDNFKEVSREKNRFEKLMEYFINDDSNIDFMVACMQFINIVVHSVENMNFRVHLQFEFTNHGLDKYLGRLKQTESEKLQVQIQAYLDNVLDVGALLEDAENRGGVLEHVDELQEHNSQTAERMSELETQLMQATKETELLKVSAAPRRLQRLMRLISRARCAILTGITYNEVERVARCAPTSSSASSWGRSTTTTSSSSTWFWTPTPTPPAWCWTTSPARILNTALESKKPIQTKFRMPLLNWQALKPNQVTGTVFNDLDDEKVLELNMDMFGEQFKTRAQGNPTDLSNIKKVVQKAPSKMSLMDANKAKNLAISLRKGGMNPSAICTAIETYVYDQKSLSIDLLEILVPFIPSDFEMKLLVNYEKDGRPLEELTDEDQFVLRFGKIPRLKQRINTFTFMGNFPDTVKRLQPQLNSIIAASMSIKSSTKLKKFLEIVLAFGNYMNSSKRGAAYGFRLQSLDLLLETKSTDRSQTLLHFITTIIRDKYPDLANFHTEIHFVDKAALVSLDGMLQDIRSLERGMETTKKEFLVQDDSPVLKEFIKTNSEQLETLIKDGKTAQEAYGSVVEYFGENPKTTQPSMFFPTFGRLIKAFKQQLEEQKKKTESESSEEKVSPNKAGAQKGPKMPQLDLIAELKKRQVKPQVREGKDGALEDIITDLRNTPYRRTDGRWPAQRQDT